MTVHPVEAVEARIVQETAGGDQVPVRLARAPFGDLGCIELVQLQIEDVLHQEQLLAIAHQNVILAAVHLVGAIAGYTEVGPQVFSSYSTIK